MVRVAPVRLQYNPKILWFDANGLDIKQGDAVVVETMRGIEFGHAAKDAFDAEEAEIKKLKSDLKKVQRIATPEDEKIALEMDERSKEALSVFKEMAAETSEDMHPVSVEFLHDGDKAVFYFEAEERIDFRDLVRKLASHFHVRIDMRQIGVRDEARIVGGLGHCGQELCCKRLGGEFNPVSIRMAKEQDLSLNPQKISGVCGRLMCCLRYEFDAYKDFKDRAPKIHAKIDTPEGVAKVIDLNVPKEVITLLLDDDKKIAIPLAEMDAAKEGERPNRVGVEAFERFANQNTLDTLDSLALPRFGEEEAQEGEGSRTNKQSKREKADEKEASRKPRRRTKVSKEGKSENEEVSSEGEAKSSRRRGNRRKQGLQSGSGGQQSKNQSASQDGKKKQSGPRPGQRSSGLRKEQGTAGQNRQDNGAPEGQKATPDAPSRRKSRRRSHKANTGNSGEANE